MIKEIKMPNLGTTTNEMKIVRWNKNVGDEIKRGELLFEVETDKAVMEVESYLSGYLKKIIVEADGMVETGSVVALIGNETDELEHEEQHEQVEIQKREENVIVEKAQEVRISPMVKKIADKLGVDYTKVQGTGPNGMITKADIENFDKDNNNETKNVEKFNRIGRATAKAMTTSKTTIPHVYFTIEIDAASMIKRRTDSNKTITYNAMIMKAVADCIKDYPYFAAKYTDEGRILEEKFNIGLAVARGNDLLVPVVADAGRLKIEEIEQQIKLLADKVKEDKLQQNDVSGGVFTITNLGGFGIDSFSAIINPPESAILAVGRIAEKVIPVEGNFEIKSIMKMTLSVDHRIINGVYAAQFLQTLKSTLERI